MEDYFALAVTLARAEAAQTGKMSDEWMAKWKASHRKPSDDGEVTRAEADAQELASFDRAEANAINLGAW